MQFAFAKQQQNQTFVSAPFTAPHLSRPAAFRESAPVASTVCLPLHTLLGNTSQRNIRMLSTPILSLSSREVSSQSPSQSLGQAVRESVGA